MICGTEQGLSGQQVVVGAVHGSQASGQQRADRGAVKIGERSSGGMDFSDFDLLKNLCQVGKIDIEISGHDVLSNW